MVLRGDFHKEMLLDHAALTSDMLPEPSEPLQLMAVIAQQSLVLSVADTYLVLGILALLLIPFVLRLTYIPAPDLHQTAPPPVSK